MKSKNVYTYILIFFCVISTTYSKEARSLSWIITWNDLVATAKNENNGKVIQIYKQRILDTVIGESTLKKNVKFTDKYRLLAIAGTYVSYRHTFSSKPYIHQTSCGDEFVTVDLEKDGRSISLDEIFNENEIFNALSADGFIKSKITENKNNLDELLEAMSSGCELYMNEGDFLKSFAFHHIENSTIAIRLGISHLCDITAGKFTQLGIFLPISADQKTLFEQAARQNLLMEQMLKKK